jgi:hypothetical protein
MSTGPHLLTSDLFYVLAGTFQSKRGSYGALVSLSHGVGLKIIWYAMPTERILFAGPARKAGLFFVRGLT